MIYKKLATLLLILISDFVPCIYKHMHNNNNYCGSRNVSNAISLADSSSEYEILGNYSSSFTKLVTIWTPTVDT